MEGGVLFDAYEKGLRTALFFYLFLK